MTTDHETELLVQHIGEANAREIVRLSRQDAKTPGSHAAFDLLEVLRPGLTSVYGARSTAAEAIKALQRHFEAQCSHPKAERREGFVGDENPGAKTVFSFCGLCGAELPATP